jgi:hypothetical protein
MERWKKHATKFLIPFEKPNQVSEIQKLFELYLNPEKVSVSQKYEHSFDWKYVDEKVKIIGML